MIITTIKNIISTLNHVTIETTYIVENFRFTFFPTDSNIEYSMYVEYDSYPLSYNDDFKNLITECNYWGVMTKKQVLNLLAFCEKFDKLKLFQ